ncbi:hypothetical protein [Azospirillum himalayense]|uniref:Uncharacterized protein n=1 Tax=Azospirillum himalayense TaxID=654847 RepID=A0ABW0GA55_9PROT
MSFVAALLAVALSALLAWTVNLVFPIDPFWALFLAFQSAYWGFRAGMLLSNKD